MTKEEIADQLFDLANALGGDETGHLAAIIHCVVSELKHDANAISMINKVQMQMALVERIRG